MKGKEVLQFIVDELKNETSHQKVIRVNDNPGFCVEREDIEGIQRILNISDFIETITEEMMKQVLFRIKEKDFSK